MTLLTPARKHELWNATIKRIPSRASRPVASPIALHTHTEKSLLSFTSSSQMSRRAHATTPSGACCATVGRLQRAASGARISPATVHQPQRREQPLCLCMHMQPTDMSTSLAAIWKHGQRTSSLASLQRHWRAQRMPLPQPPFRLGFR
jgi:hypothetical protein